MLPTLCMIFNTLPACLFLLITGLLCFICLWCVMRWDCFCKAQPHKSLFFLLSLCFCWVVLLGKIHIFFTSLIKGVWVNGPMNSSPLILTFFSLTLTFVKTQGLFILSGQSDPALVHYYCSSLSCLIYCSCSCPHVSCHVLSASHVWKFWPVYSIFPILATEFGLSWLLMFNSFRDHFN